MTSYFRISKTRTTLDVTLENIDPLFWDNTFGISLIKVMSKPSSLEAGDVAQWVQGLLYNHEKTSFHPPVHT